MQTEDMKHLTIRGVPEDLHDRLREEKERTGKSLNQTVIDLLRERLGVDSPRRNGLARFAGSWSQTDFDDFERAVVLMEEIDRDLWP
jgi:plasmid stability protein